MKYKYLLLTFILVVTVCGLWAGFTRAQDNTKHVSLKLANEVVALDTTASTVGAFLAELSIQLPAGTPVDPPLDAALKDGDSITLTTLSVTRGDTERVIPVETQFEEAVHGGPEAIVLADPGQEGLVRTSCTIFYCQGLEVGRRTREEVLRPMRPQQVICYKTLSLTDDGPSYDEIVTMRAKPGSIPEPPKRYKKIITMESTAYEPGPQSCGDSTGATATGLRAGYGVAAVDPHIIPLGTRLYIEGYGYAVAGDTGGAIKGNKIDVCFMTVDECYSWGRRDVKVYVLY